MYVRLFRLLSLAHSAARPSETPCRNRAVRLRILLPPKYARVISSFFFHPCFLFNNVPFLATSLLTPGRRGVSPSANISFERASASAAIAVHVYHVTATFALLLYHEPRSASYPRALVYAQLAVCRNAFFNNPARIRASVFKR